MATNAHLLGLSNRKLFCLFVLLSVLGLTPHAARAARFWLGGEDPIVQADKHKGDPADYVDLFRPDAPWQQAATRLDVFKLSTQFVTRAPIEQLTIVMQYLRQHHIAIGLETGVLAIDRGCGRGEGYSPPGLLDKTMRRIRRAEGVLGFVAFDGVVFHGREKNWIDHPGQVPCQDSLQELAKETIAGVALIHSYFPQAAVGSIEQLTSRIDIDRQVRDYLAFADLYRSLSGLKLAFFHADIAWHTEYQSALPLLKAGYHARGIPYGMIIDGSPDQPSDEAWVAQGLQRLRALESYPNVAPDEIVIQSWQIQPTRMLPETAPGTLTYLLRNAEMIAH